MLDVERLAAAEAVPGRGELDPAMSPSGEPSRVLAAVDLDTADGLPDRVVTAAAQRLHAAGAIVIGLARHRPPDVLADAVDLVLADRELPADRRYVPVDDPEGALEQVTAAALAQPRAALTLAWLLRGHDRRSIADGLRAESAAYSMLLAGPDFAGWLRRRGPARESDPGERVRVERDDDGLRVTLTRAGRRNAMDAGMRRALVDAFELAAALPELAVEWRAEGPSFSAGGDLDEFGSAPDVATAHLVRVLNSPAAALEPIRHRVTAYVHGGCVGAGVEIPSFAGHVVAAPDAMFSLPELAMGLIPGAGGTAGIARRIGRQRTAWLALTGDRLDAPTALGWGLVDALG
ncbi:MAG TPA: enoyl-CoA hydratase/isomerase family protein [Jatrophihabitantaceae bacterium]|jgi:enoyl-CoA hydratase/carnithine racemase